MMQTVLTNLVIVFYLVMACCFFVQWLGFFIDDKEMNSSQRFFSMVILVIATILWPLIVPLAYLELLKFHKKHKQVIDLLISLSDTQLCDE
jgi:cell shape-determining protein MreD